MVIWSRILSTVMFLRNMINKRAHLVEVCSPLISLNFYFFQNNFASLRGPKWVCSA